MRTTKIKDFLKALEEGKSKEEAIAIANCSKITANIQFVKWNKEKKENSNLNKEKE